MREEPATATTTTGVAAISVVLLESRYFGAFQTFRDRQGDFRMLQRMKAGTSQGGAVIRSDRLDLILLSARVMDAFIAGQKEQAQAMLGFSLPASFPETHDLEFLSFRRAQLESTPDWAPWLVRAVVRREDNALIGTITFHGPPGINGLGAPAAVELGYTIRPENRSRGFATEAAQAMMRWATDRHAVTHFVSCIGPDNAPSLRVIRKLGFEPTGIVDDGELIFDLRLPVE